MNIGDTLYIAYADNGEEYGDYSEHVEGVFTTFHKASLYFINEGYSPAVDMDHRDCEYELSFYWSEGNEYTDRSSNGWIEETKLK